MKGSTGEILLQLLEMRLDSIVFRLGLAPTMSAARQIVCHGHITVNGRCVCALCVITLQSCVQFADLDVCDLDVAYRPCHAKLYQHLKQADAKHDLLPSIVYSQAYSANLLQWAQGIGRTHQSWLACTMNACALIVDLCLAHTGA